MFSTHSRWVTVSLVTCLGLASVALAQPVLYQTGATEDLQVTPEFGALLMGGSSEPDDAMAWLLKRANGGDVVVLRASGSDGYNNYFYSEIGGVHSVRSYVFNSREDAFDDSMLDALEAAELIFIAGGDQSKYLKFWKGTPVQVLVNQHLAKGKPIGGTSAGLAVMGDTLYAAYKDSITSSEALKDPFSENLTLERAFLQIPFLSNVITDSHFSERGRLGRLLAFQARGMEMREGEALIGIGIDESTALCIDASGYACVFSRQQDPSVFLTFIGETAELVMEQEKPLSISELVLIGLDKDSSFQFKDLSVDKPAVVTSIKVSEGMIIGIEDPL